MKKRIFSLLLALCLVAGLLPTVAYAEGGTSHEGWTELTEEILESTYMVESLGTYKYVLPSGHYYLGGDILVDKPIRFGTSSTSANVVLDLNGYELSKDDDTALLVLQNDSTLTVMDSSENKTGKIVSDYAIYFISGSKLNANGGTIEGDVYLSGDNVAIDNTDHSNITVFRNGLIKGDYSTAIINGGIFYSTVNKSGYITGGTFYGEVTNNGTITGGTFYGTITGSGTVSDVTYRRIVTFDSNGGSEVPSQDILKDSTATEPTAPTKADYTFEGWYNGDILYDFSTPVTENITLTAKWSASRIMLTKDILESTYKVSSQFGDNYKLPDGHYYLGEDISSNKSIDIGGVVTLDLNGYELEHDSNSGTLLYPGYSSTLTLIDSSSAKTGKVISKTGFAVNLMTSSKLNANGGTIEGNVDLTADNAVIDNTDPLNITVFRAGQIEGDSSSADIKGGVFYSTVDEYYGQITGGTFYGIVSGAGTIRDSAKVTVTFDSDVGSDVAAQKVLKGQKASAPTAPTKAGYSFEGWYKGNTEFDFTNTPVIENTTLSAKWTPKTYHVTLNTNGANSCAELVGYTYGIGATLPTPVKEGYTFAGWYAANDFSDDAVTSISTTDTDDKTFYAKWVEKSNISFDTATQSYTYDGSAQAFSITGTSVTGFDISYQQNGQTVTNPTDAGSYDVIVTRAADDTYKAVSETISNGLVINPKAVTATISAIPDETYIGSDIEPAVTVYDGQTVIPASEYTVSYSDNRNAGTATVTLADKTGGNYNVTGTTTFEILPKSIDNAVITRSNTLTYDGTKQTQNISVTLDGFDAVTFDVSDNQQTDVNTNGNYTLTVTGNGNFTGTKNFNWNIAPATPAENPAKKTTARVIKGKTLSDATVTNGEILAIDGVTVLDGTFAWVDSTKAMNANGTEQMVFTPDNTNYAPITIDVAVSTYTTGGGGGGGSYTPSYTVKFETNGGTSVKNQTVVKNNKATSPSNPTREGYVFDGWYTDKGLTKKYDFDTKVTGSLTLYAKWTEEAWKNPFTDVHEGDWFYEDVAYVYEKGLMAGTSKTTFSPNATTTRGMVVTVLYRLEGSPAVSDTAAFDDVANGAYYQNAAAWAVANGITSGYGNGKFGPNDPITREQFAAFLYRYAKYKGLDVSVGEDTNILSYNDALTISEYAFPAMQWLCGEGIMQGNNGNLMPAGNATRAQIAALLHRFCENVLNG